jgi:hypothetical protein
MHAAFLPETVVQRTRGFLVATGVETPPWLGAREVVDRLADLFVARRAADGDRGRLEAFLGELSAHAGDRVAGERLRELEAEVLRPSEVADVIEALSRELSDGADRRTILDGLLSCLHAPALSALLLLGIAAGCETGGGTSFADNPDSFGSEYVPSDGVPGDDVPGDEAVADVTPDLSSTQADVMLVDWVEGSGLTDARKEALIECLTNAFTAQGRIDLATLFSTMTPQQIADHLLALTQAGGECASFYHGEPKPDTAEEVFYSDVYKGVSFPAAGR